jgi:CRISPR-associated exonuclease Cas4
MVSSDASFVATAKDFAARVEKHDLHGLLFQHVELCERRAWLHMNRINYAHLEERMQLGTVSHNLHKPRDHSVEGLMGIAPDRIDWKARKVVEAKGSAGARDAVSAQTRFYALMLSAATGEVWSAANEIIGKKKMLEVSLTLQDAKRMVHLAERLGQISDMSAAPAAEQKPICASCSYRHLCGYA